MTASALPRCVLPLLWLAALCAGMPTGAGAQLLRFSLSGGEVGVENRTEAARGRSLARSASSTFTEWLALPLRGVIISPRLLSFALNLRPSWAQQRTSGLAASVQTGLNAGFNANLLSSSPIPLSVHAERGSGSIRGTFGSETAFNSDASGATLRLQNRAFPIYLDFTDRRTTSDWLGAFSNSSQRRDEQWSTLRLTGQSTKLYTNIDRTRFVDGIGSLSFTTTMGQANHALRWGKGSSLETMVDVSWREGFDPQRRQLYSGTLHLRHSPVVSSSFSLQQQVARAPVFTSHTRAASVGVQYDPRSWLAAALDASGSTALYHNGRAEVWQVRPAVRLSRSLPRGGRLFGSVFAGYSRRAQQFLAESWVVVTGEPHGVDESRSFSLKNERGDSASVSVTSADRSVLFVVDVDYRLTRLGDLLRIAIPLGSRIVPGDAILVSYKYEMPEQPEVDSRFAGAEATITFDGISLQHSVQHRRSVAVGASLDDRLDSGDEYASMLRVHHDTRIGRVTGEGEHRVRRNSRNDFETSELRGTLSSLPGSRLQHMLGVTALRTFANTREVSMLTSAASLGWNATATFQTRASVEAWLWSPQDLPNERLLNVNIDMAWSFGALETDWRYSSQRRYTSSRGIQNQFFGRIKRHF